MSAAESRPPDQRYLALLLGVERYSASDIPDIPTVPRDLQRLESVLRESSYDVRRVPQEALTPNQISGEIARFLTSEEARDATLLLYLSGHGLSRDGKDYLLPSDVYSLDQARARPATSLFEIDLQGMVDRSPARTVVLIVDACRETLPADEKALLTAVGDGAHARRHQKLVTIFGCRPDERCLYDEDLGASLLAEALRRVLSPQHPASTLGDVIAALGDELAQLVAKYKPGREQRLHYVMVEGQDEPVYAVRLCLGLRERWFDDVCSAKLWDRADPPVGPQLRQAVEELAADAYRRRRRPGLGEAPDPFDDPGYPARVLERFDELLAPEMTLRPAEVVAVIAAPFLREAVLALALSEFGGLQPLDLYDHDGTDRFRVELEAVRRIHSRLTERARVADVVERDAIAWLLVHRAALRQVDVWTDARALRLAGDVATALDGDKRQPKTAARMLALALHVSAFSDELERDRDTDRMVLEPSFDIFSEVDRGPVRQHALAVLLAVAGQIAIDVRQIGDVFPSHLGPAEGLNPEEAIRFAEGITWLISEDRRLIRGAATCVHPALHLLAEEQATRISDLLHYAHEHERFTPADIAGLLSNLPLAVSMDDIEPERDSCNEPRYELPLLRFRLAHDEVRELLMGVRLYGDPSLAIRELYQNALDACRYREVRARFNDEPYEGRILLRQGHDGDRPFIECEDNGVGMGVYELENVFSRAGRRFVHTPEFLWEQSKWRRTRPDLRLWPNSRFGIGVFSYFMLADEVEIWTARADRNNGVAPEQIHVRISSSGSLFRLRHQEVDPRRGRGGTCVRLYLRPDEHVSCLDTLRSVLRYSEFAVVCEEGEDREMWPSRVLHVPLSDAQFQPIPAGENVWFADEGGLLADGLLTDQRRSGFIINLSGDHPGTLSVDRQRLESWDTEWVVSSLTDAARRVPADAGLTYSWLWPFVREHPELAFHVWRLLVERDFRLPLSPESSEAAVVGKLGAFAVDADLLGQSRQPAAFQMSLPSYLEAVRLRLLREWFPRATAHDRSSLALSLDVTSMPVLDPLDNALIMGPGSGSDIAGHGRAEDWRLRLLRASHRFGLGVRHVLAHQRRHIVFGYSCSLDPGDGSDPIADRGVLEAAKLFFGSSERRQWLLRLMVGAERSRSSMRAMVAPLLSFAAAGMPVPELERLNGLGELAERVPTPLEITVVRETVVGGWQDIAARLVALSLEADLATLDLEAILGRDPADYAAIERVINNPEDLILLSSDLDGATPWLYGSITEQHLAWIATEAHRDVADVLDRLRQYRSVARLELPDELPADLVLDPAWERVVPTPDGLDIGSRVLFSRDVDGESPYLQGAMSMRHLLAANAELRETLGETASRITSSRDVFPWATPVVPAESKNHRLTVEQAALLRHPGGPLNDGIEPAAFADAGIELGVSLGALGRAAMKLRGLLPSIPMLTDAQLAALDRERATAMDLDWIQRLGPQVSASDLVRAASRGGVPVGEAHRRLGLYHLLGLELVEVSPGPWSATIPEWQDLIVLASCSTGDRARSLNVDAESVRRAALLIDTDDSDVRARLGRFSGLFTFVNDEQTGLVA